MRKNKKWLWLGLLVVVAGTSFFFWKRSQKSTQPRFERITVARGDLNVTIFTSGLVQPENRVEIKPPIAGRVEKVTADEGQRVKRGSTLAWLSSTERAALLDAARAKGPEELAYWEDFYRATPLASPLDGEIIARNVEEGQTVTSADTVYVLSDHLIIKADVDETDIGRVKRGMQARFTLDSYPDEEIKGRVIKIAFESRTTNNVTTYQVFILPEKVPAYMKSGMTTNVTFIVSTHKDVLLVPAEAITLEQGQARVLKPSLEQERKKKARPQSQDITTGATDGKMTEVKDGLAENDVVLVPRATGSSGKSGKVNPFGFNAPRGGRGTR